jgi:methionyl-tRNA synthetase
VKPFFITTAIDYVNSAPHIGHAYEKVLADVIARYHRLKGDEVFYLTGVDQHGQKVQQSIEKAGLAPQEYVDQVTAKFVAVWEKLDVQYDGWAATTDASHKACVQTLLQRLHDEGQLYKATQSGYYSVRQEQFLTEKERGADGEFGPEWGEVIFIEEENWWFKLKQHKQWLLDLLKNRPELVVPKFRLAELVNAVEKLEGDLCISRPKSRLAWGIELPFDKDFVTYVWFDALVNYISFAPGYDAASGADLTEFRKWWPAIHVIGKDIMIPSHGVYWPIMLKAIGFTDEEMPQLLVHGWWNISGEKMSKSLGNVIDPDALADKYGAEAVRYYLVADISTGKDSDFSEERLIQRYNVDLANSVGNLLNRTLNMAAKYREGKVQLAGYDNEQLVELRNRFESHVLHLEGGYRYYMDVFEINTALELALGCADACNRLVENSAPWKLAKDINNAAQLDAVLFHLAESLRIIAILLSPVLPKAARGIWDQLCVEGEFALADAAWGGLPNGHQLGKPVPLFPRIEASDGRLANGDVGSPFPHKASLPAKG